MMSRVLVAAVACLTAVAPVAAVPERRSDRGALNLAGAVGFRQHTAWIEQQQVTAATPTNPFGSSCMWSINDHELVEAVGYLDPGVATSHEKCVVADFFPGGAPYGMSTVRVYAKTPGLRVAVCFSQGRCFSPKPVYQDTARRYVWRFCGRVFYEPADPALADIPGSLGGRGVVSSVSTTVSNPGGRRVRDVVAKVGYASDVALFLGWGDAGGCLPVFPYVDRFEYPFQWTSS